MKHIIEIICAVAQGIATVIIAGAMVGIFAGSAYSAFRWVAE